MCIIIDTCTFYKVFNDQNKEHDKFKPVLKWIVGKKGKIIIGGTKYAKELSSAKALGILAEFEKRNRVVSLSTEKVDKRARELKKLEPNKQFDDEHLVAMVVVSRCCVVCTDDKKAIPYLKRRDLYSGGVKPPSIYRYKTHAPMCRKKNIVKVCRDE